LAQEERGAQRRVASLQSLASGGDLHASVPLGEGLRAEPLRGSAEPQGAYDGPALRRQRPLAVEANAPSTGDRRPCLHAYLHSSVSLELGGQKKYLLDTGTPLNVSGTKNWQKMETSG
jgi:hypothetical protein